MTVVSSRVVDEFRLAIDTIPGMVWTAQPDGHVDFFNQRWLDYHGLTRSQAEGCGWQVVIHPDDLPRVLEVWQRLLASSQPGETEARQRRYDGSYRWCLLRAVPLLDERGRVTRWYGEITDIDDRKRAESLLAGEKRLLEMIAQGALLEQTLDALCRFVEREWTGSIASILFVDREGKRLQDRIAPSIPKEYIERCNGWPIGPHGGPCAMAAYHRKTVIIDDFRVGPVAEEYRALAAAHGLRAAWSIPAFSRTGRLLGTFALYFREPSRPTTHELGLMERFRDLTSIAIERTQNENALDRMRLDLAQASRVTTLGQMTASIAHEINQPLSGIVLNGNACLRWLAADPPNLVKARDAAQRIVRDGGRAGDVIRRLRSLFEGSSAAREPLAINEVIHEVLALSQGQLRKFGVRPVLKLAEDLPQVTADRVQLQQLLLNLILNAAEAMSSVPETTRDLIISSEPAAAGAQVAVRDSGVGLDPEASERIFDAFFSGKAGGLGMGLAISRSIVESHGGRLWAEPNDGPGATFVFTLPSSAMEDAR
jgi:PAS domain S-box-containing protein